MGGETLARAALLHATGHSSNQRETACLRWSQQGFEDFRTGTFGNGGQNLYVSKRGFLQRIHRFDINGDGHIDLLFINSQDMNERPPVEVISDPFGSRESRQLSSLGPYAAAVGDLTGNGTDDLVVAHQCNGTHSDVTAFIFFGDASGFSERCKIELPVPDARGVAIGDFNGDGRPDLAFISRGRIRIFYQEASGFIPREYVDLDIPATKICAGDADGDGISDLYVRVKGSRPLLLWGGPGGLCRSRSTPVGGADPGLANVRGSTAGWALYSEGWTPKIVTLHGRPHLFRPYKKEFRLLPVLPDRTFGKPLRIACEGAVAVAVGDLDGDGTEDLAVAVCKVWDGVERKMLSATEVREEMSLVFWGGSEGFSASRRTSLPTRNARDVEIACWQSSDSPAHLLLCQGRTHLSNTTECLAFAGLDGGIDPEPIRFESHDATGILVARSHPGDSNPKIVLVNHVGGRFRGDVSLFAYLGGSDGFCPQRRIELPGWSAPAATICDFNDNGHADILVANCAEDAWWMDPGSFIYWGAQEGFDPDRKLVLPTQRAHGVATGDFRHCGYLDIVVAGFSNAELLIFQGGPDGYDVRKPKRIRLDDPAASPRKSSPEAPTPNPDYAEPRWLLAADFNNDGWLDLFVSQWHGPRCLILWGGPAGFSMSRSTWLSAEGGICAQAADLSGNGFLDLVIGGNCARSKEWPEDSYVYIYWNGPEGFSEFRRQQLPAHACNSLAIADFNNDGILDIFATSYSSGRDRDCDSYIYWGSGPGVYSAENRTRIFGHSACGCIAADFDGDGFVDLAVAHHKTYGNHAGFSKVWWNGPEGFSSERVTKLPTLGPHGMPVPGPGNILDRSDEEFFESAPQELGRPMLIQAVRWEAELQPETWVRAQIRCADERENLSAAPWQGSEGIGTWFEVPESSPTRPILCKKWFQYRLTLGARNSGNSPRLSQFEIKFILPNNPL